MSAHRRPWFRFWNTMWWLGMANFILVVVLGGRGTQLVVSLILVLIAHATDDILGRLDRPCRRCGLRESA